MSLLVLDTMTNGKLAPRDGVTQTISAAKTESTLSVSLAAGNLDNDGGSELAVVVNELYDAGGEQGVSRYFIYDAGSGPLDAVASGNSSVIAEADTHVFRIAGAAIADVTGDGRADLVLGGLSTINSNCAARTGIKTRPTQARAPQYRRLHPNAPRTLEACLAVPSP